MADSVPAPRQGDKASNGRDEEEEAAGARRLPAHRWSADRSLPAADVVGQLTSLANGGLVARPPDVERT
jgi:hypothetical protein